MTRDTKDFRERFNRWKKGDKVYDAGRPLQGFDGGKDEYIPRDQWAVDPITGNTQMSDGRQGSVVLPEVTVQGKDPNPIRAAYRAMGGRATAFHGDDFEPFVEFIPGVGDAYQGYQAVNALQNKQYGKAAFLGGMLLLPNFIEKPLRTIFKPFGSSISSAVRSMVSPRAIYRAISDKYGIQLGKSFYRNPDRFYRQVGRVQNRKDIPDAIADAENTGLIRSNNPQWDYNAYFSRGRYDNKSYNTSDNVAVIESKPNVGGENFAYVQDGTMNIDPTKVVSAGESAFPIIRTPYGNLYTGLTEDFRYWTPFNKFGIRGWKRREFRSPAVHDDYLDAAQLDAAYFRAIKAGNIAEAQRLRDLHFMQNAPNTVAQDNGIPAILYHGTPTQKKFYNIIPSKDGTFGYGVYTTPTLADAKGYAGYKGRVLNLYSNLKNPYDMTADNQRDWILKMAKVRSDSPYRYMGDNIDGVVGTAYNKSNYNIEVVNHNPSALKLADAITHDDAGNIIPLSQRDNFKLNDIRYMLPWGVFGIGSGLYNTQQK